MTIDSLKELLDAYYSRYTIKIYHDVRKAGSVVLYLPFTDNFFEAKLIIIKPVNVSIYREKLSWWSNWFNRKKFIISY